MTRFNILLRLPLALVYQIDAARGAQDRTAWIMDACIKALAKKS